MTIGSVNSESLINNIDLKLLGFQYSGVNLINEVNSLNPSLVIDVGCGTNYFRGKIKNLIGFDIADHPNLDFCCSISDMKVESNSVDVVLALGTFQYLTKEQIFKDVSTIVNWVKPGGYIVVRLLPFIAEANSISDSFRWSQEWFEQVTDNLGLKLVKGIYLDKNKLVPNLERIVWWWQKQ
jgi:SAM-dependent methyltransferase